MSRLPLVWLLLFAVCPAALARTGAVDQTLVNTFTAKPLTAGRGCFRPTHDAHTPSLRLLDDEQLNVGNTFAATPGMLARGGGESEAYSGFNLSRKF